MTAYTNVIVSLIALITSMIIHRNYAAPAVLFAILAQALTMANSMRTNPRNWHHDFARGFPTLGHTTPDLPYELLASAERLTTCPDPHETCLKVAITNIGTWSKYVVVKYKYLVSSLHRIQCHFQFNPIPSHSISHQSLSSSPSHRTPPQGFMPSLHCNAHDTADVLAFKTHHGDSTLDTKVSDILLFFINVCNVKNMPPSAIESWIKEWWSGLPLGMRRTGRSVVVSPDLFQSLSVPILI
jgi:hypothetical protein